MKIRNGFVSNSSSSSFIVPSICKEEAEKLGLKLISISELKKIFLKLEEIGGGWLIEYNYRFEEIKKLNEDDYISEPFDRDRAYELGINYGVFEEKL